MNDGLELSIIIPAFNEARRIEETLGAICSYLDARGETFEIIVIADGTDDTRERARAFAASHGARIHVAGSVARRGKGKAIREGVALSGGKIVGFVDADYKTPIEEMEKLLPWLRRGYEIAIGSRALSDSRVEIPQPVYRRWGSQVFGIAMHVATGLWRIRDTQCGFKFFQSAVARDLFGRQRVDGYMFDVEVLYLAQQTGYRTKEVGIRWRDDGDSRLDLLGGNLQNMIDILRIRLMSPPPLLPPARTVEFVPKPNQSP